MTGASLKKRSDGVAELSFNGWMQILGSEAKRHDESVVALARLGKGDVLRLSKAQWHRGFKGVPGLLCGSGNELKPGGDGGRTVCLNSKVVRHLDVGEKSMLCVTRRDGAYFLKRFACRELVSESPG